ncbi:MAG TPA: Fic/DOC family N-terminal domain-containing protein, partial [Rugosimonospora sp.]|nr:Fic/DOC family N-terminal domain-containing protein [Rugosimonospora sp.]
MNVADFVAPASGQLVRITGWDPRYGERYEHFAFVPAPLPPRVELTHATHRAVTAASVAVARLDEAAKRLPNPALLARPAIRQEAVSTSALEGTYAAL